MSRNLNIVTPENVEVTFELAGLGTRFLAALMDYFMVGLAAAVLGFLFFSVGASTFHLGGVWLIAACVLVVFCVDWCYFIGFESRNGQTPGKRYMGLRVLRDGGFPLDLRGAILRNFLRPVDFLPSLYCVGTITIFASATNKRLGDIAAGTVVVRERRSDEKPHFALTPAGKYGPEITYRLTEQDRVVLHEYVERLRTLGPGGQDLIGVELARKLSTRVGLSIPQSELTNLLSDVESP